MICDGKQKKPLAKTRGFRIYTKLTIAGRSLAFAVIAHQLNFVIGKPYCFERCFVLEINNIHCVNTGLFNFLDTGYTVVSILLFYFIDNRLIKIVGAICLNRVYPTAVFIVGRCSLTAIDYRANGISFCFFGAVFF